MLFGTFSRCKDSASSEWTRLVRLIKAVQALDLLAQSIAARAASPLTDAAQQHFVDCALYCHHKALQRLRLCTDGH